MAAGTVYLRTNRFEVKLEGITFKARDFESVCSQEFLFPEGKIWARPPIVGIDVMHHPRDPSMILLLLCFGVGCVILRFHSGDSLPESIFKFLTNERVQFVGFGIPEKKDLFPFEELGLTKNKVDIGYLSANILDDPRYKRCELAELARKVLRIKTMIGLTEASSFERHEQIKCAICQLFITWAIAMVLLRSNDKKKLDDSPKKMSFLKNLNSLPLFTEGWFKFTKIKKETEKIDHAKKGHDDLYVQTRNLYDSDNYGDDNVTKALHKKGPSWNAFIQATIRASDFFRDQANFVGNKDSSSSDDTKGDSGMSLSKSFNDVKGIMDSNNSVGNQSKDRPLKGILKCPSRQALSNPSPQEQRSAKPSFKRSVSFK